MSWGLDGLMLMGGVTGQRFKAFFGAGSMLASIGLSWGLVLGQGSKEIGW